MTVCGTAWADASYVDQARVLSVAPQVERINQPRQECRTDYVTENVYAPERSNTGAVIGGVAGGLLGSKIGRGAGRIAAAAVGAGLGAIVGDRVANPVYANSRTVTRPVSQCVMVDQWQMVTTGYMVNYEYQGRQYATVMARDPGPFIEVSVAVQPQYGPQASDLYRPVVYQPDRAPQAHGHRRYW